MKKTSLLFIALIWFQMVSSQSSTINAYDHVIVPMQFDFQSEPNQYQLNILARILLKEEGFTVFMDKEERPLDYRGNSCKPLFMEVEDTSGFLNLSLVVRLKDCHDNILFESEEGKTKIKEFKEGYQDALRQAFVSLSDLNYQYNNDLSNEEEVSTVKNLEISSDSSAPEDIYPDKKIYKFGGEIYWLVKQGDKNYRLLTNAGKENYAELENADKGTFIFNSKSISGAAFFDAEGNLTIEYRDEDLDEVQKLIFRKVD